MIKAVIVDDELLARKNLRLLLEKHCATKVAVVGECEDIDTAYTTIKQLDPQLVFLDIEIGMHSGFDLLTKFTHHSFKIVFITAYDKYAIQAFKFCAQHYILKPIDIDELVEAVDRVYTAQHETAEQIANLLDVIQKPKNSNNRISISVGNGIRLVKVENIVYLESQNSYTQIYCSNKERLVSSTPLADFEAILNDYSFYRIHNSYLVNKEHITGYTKGDAGELSLSNGANLPISRRKKPDFVEWMQG